MSFGFESEWEVGATELVQSLHREGLCGMNRLHGYHCDCEDCDFSYSEYPLRAQRDSTCDGEIISSPQDEMDDDVRDILRTIQNCAVDVDAEPGLNSGFHVHVGVAGRRTQGLCEAVRAFLKWEPVLTQFAGGRWIENRGFNTTFANSVYAAVRDASYDYSTDSRDDLMEQIRFVAYGNSYEMGQTAMRWLLQNDGLSERHQREGFLYNLRSQDRHANLSTRTSYETWEYRLWNSTRSAWRMELWCRLSVALLNPTTVRHLNAVDTPSLEELPLLLDGGRLSELTLRQVNYIEKAVRDGVAPALTLNT